MEKCLLTNSIKGKDNFTKVNPDGILYVYIYFNIYYILEYNFFIGKLLLYTTILIFENLKILYSIELISLLNEWFTITDSQTYMR